MKKIIISMVLVVLLATVSSAKVVIIKRVSVQDERITLVILCINGYEYVLTKYTGHTASMTQNFEEKEGRSVPIKCNYK